MGVGIISSDESDTETIPPTYRIKTLPWRNPEMTVWLRTLDVLYVRSRAMTGRNKRGAHPHPRYPSSMQSTRPAPYNLPEDAYDSTWLTREPPHEREDYERLQREPWGGWSHSASVQQ
jgi:hypothetical protein